ncbi:MAG: permease [Patescibacteria group bacterium]|nr:permease [Patescibacteria group bacterium]
MSEQKSSIQWKSYIYLLLFAVILAVIFYFFPDKATPSLKASWDSLSQFLLILPAIILLIGIFSVVVDQKMIEKNFGEGTGFGGNLKALFFGSLMSTGPFYLSFPMAKNLLEKGAKISDVLIFVSAWNGVGVIAELVEFHFMGPVFMVIRCSLTAIFILVIGYVGKYLYKIK